MPYRKKPAPTLTTQNAFELLIQSVTDYAIYMLDTGGYITHWNIGAEHIKGYPASEIIGKNFSSFYIPEDVASGLPERALEIAKHEGRYETEGWRQRKDGSRFWAFTVLHAIQKDGQVIGFAKVTRDLTEIRNTQIALEQSREQLFQLQKMEAVGQLTGGLAHDFNNMLAGISGSLELLQKRLDQGVTRGLDRYIGVAQAAAKKAAALTHRLLAFSRRQTLDPRPIQADALISGMVEMLRRTVGPEISIEVKHSPTIPATLCDPNQLENALLNLCINARDAMPNGGDLTIETCNYVIDKNASISRDIPQGNYVVICVEDTGHGMPPEVVARAFDPFFTTKPIGQGTGLGLSMIYGFARQSGGDVRIFSELGKGTTVKIYLPLYKGDDVTDAMTTDIHQAPHAEEVQTILVIDDEEPLRLLLTEVLEDLGYVVAEAEDGASGLKVLRSNPAIDLLITDVGLPNGMNGRQVADAARDMRPDLKVMFITGYAENAVVGNGRLEPGMHILTKPFPMAVLASRVKEILSGD